MESKLKKIKEETLAELEKTEELSAWEILENKILGRKNGILPLVMKELANLPPEEKKRIGQLANEVKKEIEDAFFQKKQILSGAVMEGNLKRENVDITAPALPRREPGHHHPISLVRSDLEDFFASLGFMVLDGPELESDYYNFTAVNIPPDHPARDMQDTFYIKDHPDSASAKATADAWVLRTHTSSVQVRAMQKYGAPLRMISAGKCFRNEATDVRHEHTFYQLEGVVVDEEINFGHMKGILEAVAGHLYGPETKLRLRPKFFPFVEPGVNGEVTCFLCGGKGCRLCKNSGWLEIFGAGMIHPNVLKEGGIGSKKYQGFAFGFGLSRLVMLKYGIEDVRLLESGDLRFLKQF